MQRGDFLRFTYLAVDRAKKAEHQRPCYTLDELLAQDNPKARRSREECEWLTDKPAGRELI